MTAPAPEETPTAPPDADQVHAACECQGDTAGPFQAICGLWLVAAWDGWIDIEPEEACPACVALLGQPCALCGKMTG